MLQLLPQNNTLIPNCITSDETINYINSYIDNYHCKNMSVDISYMNILDASYVSTMCSTKHFIKYPDGHIEWKVSSNLIEEFNKEMSLGNSSFIK